MKDIIIVILAIIIAYMIIGNQFGFSLKGFFTRLQEKSDPVIDYNTLEIRSISELDDYDRGRLKKEYDQFCESVSKTAEDEHNRQLEQIKSYNSKCPSCNDQEVIQRLETGSEKGYGKYSTIRTTKTTINHCRACGHDWDHKENRTYTSSKYDMAEYLITLLRYYHEAKHETKFDPNKLDNEYGTLEDAQNAAMQKIRSNHYFIVVMPHLKGKSVELVKYLVENVYGEFEQHKWKMDRWYMYDKRPLLDWGLKQLTAK